MIEGYTQPTPLSISIENIGNLSIGKLTITLSGINASSFTLSDTSISEINENGNFVFSFTPKKELEA